jgi:hypothetical protein
MAEYINEYKNKLINYLKDDIYKLLEDIKKGIETAKEDNV